MFEKLTEKLLDVVKNLRGKGTLSESNIEDAVRAVRMALLEGDVHISVVKDIVEGVKAKAIGQDVLKSLTPDQQFIKILYDELVRVWVKDKAVFIFLLCLPVSLCSLDCKVRGKTTTAAKNRKILWQGGTFNNSCSSGCLQASRATTTESSFRTGKMFLF